MIASTVPRIYVLDYTQILVIHWERQLKKYNYFVPLRVRLDKIVTMAFGSIFFI